MLQLFFFLLLLSFPLLCSARINSYWMFWYYGDSGDRYCGNYCVIVFSATAFLLLLIMLFGCLKFYFMRQRYEEDENQTSDTKNVLNIFWSDRIRKNEKEATELYKKRLD